MINKVSFSIDKKLILLVLLVSVTALFVTAFLSFNYAEQILIERIGEQLLSESSIRGDAVKDLLDTRIKEIKVLSRDRLIQNLVQEINNESGNYEVKIKQSEQLFLGEIKEFQNIVGFSIGLEDVKIIGKNGIVYFSTTKLPTNDFSNEDAFLNGLTRSYVDFESTSNYEKKMLVSIPIYVAGTTSISEPIGVLVSKMRTTQLDEIWLNRGGLGVTGETYMVNDDYLMLSESRFIENAIFNQRVETQAVKDCFENEKNTVGLYKDYRGIDIYGSSYCAKDLGFVLLAEIDAEEVLEPIFILQDRIFLTGIVITLIMAGVAFVLSKGISRPLKKLQNAANEIAEGNFGVRTNIKTNDEIGNLSVTFDAMAKKLQDSLLEIKDKESVIRQQEDILLQFSDYSENYCVCMVDIMNSTKITSNLSDEDTSEFYEIFLNSTATMVRNFGGIVVKNIGDALLFYFPKLPNDEKNVFKQTIECCLYLGKSSDRIKEEMRKADLPTFDYRISATFGPVRIAKMSTSSVNDIFGSTVNRCAKINRAAPANGLIVGDDFYENAKSLEEYSFKKVSGGLMDEEYGFIAYIVSEKKQ